MGLRKRPPLDATPPNGVFVRTPDFKLYYVKAGQALIIAEVPFESWGMDAIPVTRMAMQAIEMTDRRIGFRDGTLVKDFADGIMYLISDSKRRRIENPDVFEALGGKKRLMTVPSEYIRLHVEGEPI
jgi:hypothetical protein